MTLAACFIVLKEPGDGLLDGNIEWSEFKVREVLEKLFVAGSLLELTIRAASIETVLSLEVNSTNNGISNILDRNLILLTHRENDRLGFLVFTQDPDEELGKITRVDELTEGLASTTNNERSVVLLGQIALVGQTRQDVRVLEIIVVVGTKDVGGNDRGEVAAILLVVCLVLDIDHTLSVGIAKVGLVRRTVVDHGLIDRVGGLVGEDAGGKAGNNLLDTKDLRSLKDVVINKQIITKEIELVFHVLEKTTDKGSQMNDMGGLVLFKDSLGIFWLSEIAIWR